MAIIVWNIRINKNIRNNIHVQLGISCIIFYFFYLLWAVLYYVISSHQSKIACNMTQQPSYMNDIIPVLSWFCMVCNMLYTYGKIASFFWMLVEGLMLYWLLFWTYTEVPKTAFFLIGWVLPLIPTTSWVYLQYRNNGTDMCFVNAEDSLATPDIDMIYRIPIWVLLGLNTIILLRVIKLLRRLAKAKKLNAEQKLDWNTAQAVLKLTPVLGIHVLLIPKGITICTDFALLDSLRDIFNTLNILVCAYNGVFIAIQLCYLNDQCRANLAKTVIKMRNVNRTWPYYLLEYFIAYTWFFPVRNILGIESVSTNSSVANHQNQMTQTSDRRSHPPPNLYRTRRMMTIASEKRESVFADELRKTNSVASEKSKSGRTRPSRTTTCNRENIIQPDIRAKAADCSSDCENEPLPVSCDRNSTDSRDRSLTNRDETELVTNQEPRSTILFSTLRKKTESQPSTPKPHHGNDTFPRNYSKITLSCASLLSKFRLPIRPLQRNSESQSLSECLRSVRCYFRNLDPVANMRAIVKSNGNELAVCTPSFAVSTDFKHRSERIIKNDFHREMRKLLYL